MTEFDFSIESLEKLFDSEETFPVDFDYAWQAIGYASKQKALKALYQFFREDIDFRTNGYNASTGGRPSTAFFITIECFEKMKLLKSQKPLIRQEKIIQQKLQVTKGGQTEVLTPVGKIDLLTSLEIIEIKKIPDWKYALGQILAYGHYYPSHQKVICLFGHSHTTYKEIIEDICLPHKVVVEWFESD